MKAPQWRELKAKHIREGRPKVQGVVLHDTAGSGTHNDTLYLANPGDGRVVSVDFTVERDGGIWKLNPNLTQYYCLHAGRATRFKGLSNSQVTRATIGIEICQHVKLSLSPVYTSAQVKSVAQLCAWLTGEFKLTTSDITTHRQVITDGSRSDPRQFPFEGGGGFWSYYWQFLGKGAQHAVSEVMAKTPDLEKPKLTHNVAAGDTLSKIAKKYYGKSTLWPRIQKANALKGTVILPGQVLVIPQKG